MFTSCTKREIRYFHFVVVCAVTVKMIKKRDARAELLFCQSKPSAFFAVLVDLAFIVTEAPYLK